MGGSNSVSREETFIFSRIHNPQIWDALDICPFSQGSSQKWLLPSILTGCEKFRVQLRMLSCWSKAGATHPGKQRKLTLSFDEWLLHYATLHYITCIKAEQVGFRCYVATHHWFQTSLSSSPQRTLSCFDQILIRPFAVRPANSALDTR